MKSIFKNKEGFFFLNASGINRNLLQVINPLRFSVFRPCIIKFSVLESITREQTMWISLWGDLSVHSALGQTQASARPRDRTLRLVCWHCNYNYFFNIKVSVTVRLGFWHPVIRYHFGSRGFGSIHLSMLKAKDWIDFPSQNIRSLLRCFSYSPSFSSAWRRELQVYFFSVHTWTFLMCG